MNPREAAGRVDSEASRGGTFDAVDRAINRVRRSVKMHLAESVLREHQQWVDRPDVYARQVSVVAQRASECLVALNQASNALMG